MKSVSLTASIERWTADDFEIAIAAQSEQVVGMKLNGAVAEWLKAMVC